MRHGKRFCLHNQTGRFVYSSGRWGPRRVRTTECFQTFRVENLYTSLLENCPDRVVAGASGSSIFGSADQRIRIEWEIRANAVWRQGRVFFLCGRCRNPCTRLYCPRADSEAACRTCWGLTYSSRSLRSYRESLWGRGPLARFLGTTQRLMALEATQEARAERYAQCLKRWDTRRGLRAARPARG